MWATGCVLAELISDIPLFPGTSSMNMINLVRAGKSPPATNSQEGSECGQYAAAPCILIDFVLSAKGYPTLNKLKQV